MSNHIDFGSVTDQFDTKINCLYGLTEMLETYLGEHCTTTSRNGVIYLFEQQLQDLRDLYSSYLDTAVHANATIERLERDLQPLRDKLDKYYLHDEGRLQGVVHMWIRRIVLDAITEGSGKPDSEQIGEIDKLTGLYTLELVKALVKKDDLFEAGTLLPAMEKKIRDEMALPYEPPAVIATRDRLIAEMVAAGTPAAEVSQTFNIKRETVERIAGRLATNDGVTDDVRSKIEQAVDATAS